MNKYIVSKIKEMIESSRIDWAKNFIVKDYQSQFDTPEAKKEVAAATHNMSEIEKKTAWLEKYLKTKTKK